MASVPKGGKGWGRVWVCTLAGTGTTWFQYFSLLEVTPTEETSVLGVFVNVDWNRLVPVLFPLGVTPTEATSGLSAQGRYGVGEGVRLHPPRYWNHLVPVLFSPGGHPHRGNQCPRCSRGHKGWGKVCGGPLPLVYTGML